MRHISLREIRDVLLNIEDDLANKTQLDDAEINQLNTDINTLRLRVHEAMDAIARKTPVWHNIDKPLVTVDFDGVIHAYKSGWQGATVISDDPIPGAFDFLRKLTQVARVMIFSARCNEYDACLEMYRWFLKHGLETEYLDQITFEPGKPSWFLHIDDRNIQFDGDWSKLDAEKLIETFRPWYYSVPGWRGSQQQSKG